MLQWHSKEPLGGGDDHGSVNSPQGPVKELVGPQGALTWIGWKRAFCTLGFLPEQLCRDHRRVRIVISAWHLGEVEVV